MPLGFERINERRRQPNERIVFIKPLDGPDKVTAQDYLERIAAICNPVMKANHLYVVSLEEYEPNREFLGRNFNGGEVIQLVLKSTHSGQWLPFRFVQMVMMHELAHCKQMNHSKAFWKVRDGYASELRALWSTGYTGEGLWSRGRLLESGRFSDNNLLPSSPIPEHLCGGTYRSSRKRSKKPKLSYKEQKERRIAKKFGTQGVALGGDDETKVKLEKGKKVQGKPRVANSARGRELRAAAALARFETIKPEGAEAGEDSSDEASDSDDPAIKTEADAYDIDGSRMLDSKGRSLVKICEDEESTDTRNELEELRTLDCWIQRPTVADTRTREPSGPTHQEPSDSCSWPANSESDNQSAKKASKPAAPATCSICSMDNAADSLTCSACAHVLQPHKVPGSWQCSSDACRSSAYVNAGDCGRCGVCGVRKPP